MALNIAKMALQGLVHIHSLGLVHNDITPRNIMYNPKDLSKTTIIDLAHVSYPGNDVRTFETSDMTDFFRAPETYDFTFDERTDVFSMAAVLYAMLFGKAPWSNETTDKVTGASMLKELMLNRLSFSGSFDKCPTWLQSLLKTCLSFDPNRRIQSSQDFLQALENEVCQRVERAPVKTSYSPGLKEKSTSYGITQKEGNGFADVAGMDDIKAMLQQKVLFLLKNPEKAQKYKLTLPNGMLLYGPPGCGKTFFAEKFAEEAGLNYICVKGSDIGSSYIHGS